MGNRGFLSILVWFSILTLTLAAPAMAAVTISPTGGDDTSLITNAITTAALDDGIVILNPGTYYAHQIVVSNSVTIRANTSYGGSASDTIIDAQSLGRIFDNSGGHALAIDNLTLRNGFSVIGGAIINTGTVTITDSTISGCVAGADGGAIHNGGTVTITDSTISGCVAVADGGAIDNHDGGIVTMTDSTISGCTAIANGGAINNHDGGIVTMTGSTISGCWTNINGGAIYNGGTVTITDSTISGCWTSNNGGAIFSNGDTVTITGSTITGCTATNGGAIINYGTTITITGSTITGCTATDGGAIWSTVSTVTIQGSSIISDCTASHNGGAIYNFDTGTVTVTGSTISGCTAIDGGAIYNFETGIVTITVEGSSTITGCSATNGGAIYNEGGAATITGSTITGCSATNGGAIYNEGGTVTITGSTITGCTATGNGGAIYSSGPTVTINSSTFTNCSATGSGSPPEGGGAIYTRNGAATITSTTFSGCSATDGGGAINANGGTLTLHTSRFSGCTANTGGAVLSNNIGMYIDSTEFSGCSAAADGGAIYGFSTHFEATNATFSGCSVPGNGGAIYGLYTFDTYIDSSTFSACSAASGGAIFQADVVSSALSVHFSRIINCTSTALVKSSSTGQAQNNWWGTNEGPSGFISGSVDADPWLVLGITADPASIDTAQTSAIRTNLTYNATSTGQPVGDTSGGGIYVPDGITNTFAMVSGSGAVLPLTDGTANGVAETTFTPQYGETVNISGTVDDQTVYIEIPVAQAAPVPTDITPDTGVNTSAVAITNLAGSSFTIYGTTAVNLTRAGLANITATGVTVVDNTQITCTLPITGAEAGPWDVVVINPDGQEGVLPGGFTITAPAPTIISITPATGMNTSAVTITDLAGTYFQTGATVLLTRSGYADITATSVTVAGPGTITCTLPITGAEAGPWDVVVINPDGQEGVIPGGFTITAPAPTAVPTTVPTAVSTTYHPDDDSGNTLSDFPPSAFPLMTVIVNIGGDSKAWQAIVTGTKLSDLIVTGNVQYGSGGNFTVPPGIVFQYISLVPARYNTITNAVINFTVPQSWLEENHIDPGSIVLYRLTANGWEALPTTVLYTKDGTVYFSAVSPGFSLFAIAGTPTVLTPPKVAATQEIVSTPVLEQPLVPAAVAKAPVTTQTTAPPVPSSVPAGSSPFPVVPVLIGIGCVGLIGGGWYVRRWWIRRQNPALFAEYD